MKKKVVLVDDEKLLLKTLKGFIEFKTDFRVIAFSDPEDALRYMLDEKNIYALVTDLEMPQMNGFELAKQIDSKLPKTKIIVMSGRTTNYLERLALKYEICKSKLKILSKSYITNIVALLNS